MDEVCTTDNLETMSNYLQFKDRRDFIMIWPSTREHSESFTAASHTGNLRSVDGMNNLSSRTLIWRGIKEKRALVKLIRCSQTTATI